MQLLKQADGDAVAAERARTMMERQLLQMVRLVDDLMDVSRISKGKLELRKQKIDLAEVVKSAIETSRPLIEQMEHDLKVVVPDQPVTVEADPTRLAQVFMNLLNNSAKYSDRGSSIFLTVEGQQSEVVVRVRDQGIGISADQLPRIFQMFSQVHSSLERAQGGLGIGLSLVKQIVNLHGGRIEATSPGLGLGSEFIVRLPIVDKSPSPQQVFEATNGFVRSSLRILIVDDNRDGADSLAMMLKLMGNEVATAYDGQEALDEWQSFRPEVILLDLGLPKLNGYETCRRIRQQPGGEAMIYHRPNGVGPG